MADEAKQPDFNTFCELIVDGKTQLEAFKGAGGYSTSDKRISWERSAQRFSAREDVKEKILELTQERAMNAQMALVRLAPLAIDHMEVLLKSDDPKDARAKDKVAENIMLRVKDIVPQHVKVSHKHGINEIDLEGLIDKLIEHVPGEAAKLIEGEVVEQPEPSAGITDGSDKS